MARRVSESELILKIDAFTPETLPLNVFAEYVAELVNILGDPHNVSFVRVGKGSAKLIQKVKPHAIAAVKERVESVRHGKGPAEALSAFRHLNELLARDNAVATLTLGKAKLIEFPGRKNKPEPPIGPVTQPDFIDGQLIRAGGKDDTVPIHIREQDGTIRICTASVAVATELGPYLYRQTIRVYGTGYWYRQAHGEWTLDLFRIDRFEPLDDRPLTEAIEEVRRIEAEDWPDDIAEALVKIRK